MARLGHRGGIRVLLLGAAIVAFVIPPASVEAAGTCATPGRDGTATLNSVINTYYPGALTAAAGATTITLGTATGAGTPIAVGDLVVVIQMQDAAIDSANTGAYGNGIAGDPASGWTGLNSAGLYEYAVATSAVPLVGGALTISSGLLNTYTSALATPLQGQRNFQVIRVPQYVTATLAGGLAAGAFNGSTGGVLVFDVDGALNLNGAAVSVSQEGFRAGLGRQLAGGAGGTGTDYVNLSANNFHAQKGEGIAGTPQYVFDSRTGGTVNNLVDGYPNGSTARGAPATAGGGGTDPHPSATDRTTGGGGGANGGAGGMGGNSWNTNQATGGFGGTAFPATAARVTAGAGGGAGTRNNAGAANASSGGNGGAIVMIRTGSVTGTGTITTDGGTGVSSGAECTPDLTLAKSHADPFVRGSSGTYILTVGNVGGSATSGTTTVTDTLPAGLTPTAASGTGWSCGIAAQTVTCTSTDVVGSNGSFPAISITVNVGQAAAASLTNTATVSGGGEINTANDSANDGTNVVSRADIAVAKIASSGSVTVGSNVDFTITVTNNGPSDATGVQITDQLPAGLTLLSATPSVGTYNSATGVWNIGALASAASATLTLTATVTTTGAITNTATKTAENEADPNAGNDSASATVSGQAPDLTILKSHVDPFVRGTNDSYSLVVNNIGPVSTSGAVTVTDTLPAGLTPSSASGTGWTCGVVAQVVTCTRSDALAAAGSYPVITITVAVGQAAATPRTNTASVSGGGEINTGNDSASDLPTVTSQADIDVAKIVSSGSAMVGSNIDFTITVTNAGPSNATGVQVTDQLPAGLTFVSATPSAGSYNSGTGVWNIGAVASGASETLTITATVTTVGAHVNTATKTAENEADPNAGNDSASATVSGQAPDLTIAKSHVDPFVRGTSGGYTLTVSNVGPVPSSGLVTVSDALPAGLPPSSASGTGWTCGIVVQVVTCTRSDALAAAGSYPAITITVAVQQSAAGSLTNNATVAGGGEVNAANDSASDPTTVTSRADVGVTKTASNPTVIVGSPVTYTVTAFNAGPSDATGVQVTDLLPAGLTFVSASPSFGTYDSVTGVWTIGSLPSATSATLTLFATVTGTGTITNGATKSAENEIDPNLGNNAVSAAIVGQAAPGLPGPPNGGMAPAPNQPDAPRSSLIIGAGLIGFFGLLFLRRRSQRVAVAGALLAFATLTTIVAPAGAPLSAAPAANLVAARPSDIELFGKPISTVKPQLGAIATAFQPATGPIVPYRIRIPALGIDTVVESVGVTASGLMDVPSNIWDAGWLETGAEPGASGQAIIDGHLDSVRGSAVFSDLHRLQAGDRVYVSDAAGHEVTFSVTALQVEPLDGFPTLRVFGPAKGRLLNLITCAGHFDPVRRTYDHRLVVSATLV